MIQRLKIVLVILGLTILKMASCVGPVSDRPQSRADEGIDTLAWFNAQIEKDSASPQLHFNKASWLSSKSDSQHVKMATASFRRAIQLEPENVGYRLTFSDYFLTRNDPLASIDLLQEGLEMDPKQKEYLLESAKLNFYIKRYDVANQFFSRLMTAWPGHDEGHFFKGLMLKEQGNTNEAVHQFEAAIESNPDHFDALIQLGLHYSMRAEPLALPYLENALRVRPQSTEALYAKAMFFQGKDDFERAKPVYEKIHELNPLFADAYYNYAYLYFLQDSLEVAFENFEKASAADPEMAKAWFMIGEVHFLNEAYDKAMNAYKTTLNLDNNFTDALRGIQKAQKQKNL